MDDTRQGADPRLQSQVAWLHELRNVANTAGVTVALAKRMIDLDDTAGASEMLAMAEQALGRCRDMLADPVAKTACDANPIPDWRAPQARASQPTHVHR